MTSHRIRGWAAGLTAGALGLGAAVVPITATAALAAEPAAGTHVSILHFNDFHGRIADGTTVPFAGAIEEARAEFGEDSTLVLSGGDNIGASLYTSSAQKDKPTLDVLNALEIDASSVGNHEFDRGIADLQGRVADAAVFPYLAANVTLDGAPIGDSYATFEVDGVTIGVIGAVTEETPTLVSPGGIVGVEFGDPVEAVNAVAAQLTDGDAANGEADVIVAEYHEGSQAVLAADADQATQAAALEADAATNAAFASIVNETAPSVDAIFNAHTHNTYTWLADAPAGSANAVRPIIQAGSYAAQLAELAFTYDAASDVVTFDEGFPRIVGPSTTAVETLVATYPRVAAVSTIVDAAVEQAEVIGNEPLGTQSADITTAYANGKRDDRGSASTMGTLVANMYLEATADASRGGAQIGVTNPGGLRAELPYAASGAEGDGVITVGEAASVLPFANNLWTVDLTGAQLRTLLEQQWQTDADGNVPSRAYLQLGLSDNVEYSLDSSAALGSHIRDIYVDDVLVTDADVFRVAAPVFLTGGGDNFRIFTEGANLSDSGLVDSDAFQAYIQANSPLAPDFSRRQLDIVGLPTAPVAGGSTVSFTVNDVTLTSLGVEPDATVEVQRDGQPVGSFDVVDGSAAVSFTVPDVAGEPETQSYTLVTSVNGTSIPFSIDAFRAAERIEGADRYETAVALSQSAYADGADVVYVASGESFPDALAAGPAAAHQDAPVLLTASATAFDSVLAEATRLAPERIVIVGGESAISADVEAAFAAIATVDRVDGATRIETANAIAAYAFADGVDAAYVADGYGFADALSAGAAAGAQDLPILLVDGAASGAPESVLSAIADLGVDSVRIAGGPDVISSSVFGSIGGDGVSVRRIFGADRFETSLAVNRDAFPDASASVFLASGVSFPDALAGSAVAGAQGVPLYISMATCIPQGVADEIDRLGATDVTVIGGEQALSGDVASLTVCQ